MTWTEPTGPARPDLEFPTAAEGFPVTGERYVPGIPGAIRSEHMHRYLFAAQFCDGRRVLDVACGEGYGSSLLSRVASHVTGVDLDAETVRHAAARYADAQTVFCQGDAARLPLGDASVDVVVSFETIEHFAHHAAFLAELRRVLSPGGLVVLSSPDKVTYDQTLPVANPFHIRELTRDELSDLLAGCFAHVRVLEQQYLIGSVIVSSGDCAAPQRLHSADGRRFWHGMAPDRAMYAIAIASDADLPAVGSSVMHDSADVDRSAGDLRRALDEVTRLQRDIALARAETAYLRQRLLGAD